MAKKKKTPPKRKGTNKKTPSKRASSLKGKGARSPKASKAHTSATKGNVAAKGERQATPPKKVAHDNDPTKPKRAGILEAAVLVLKEAKQPKRCSEIIEVMLKKNYWTTGGKTPAATLNSSMIREIRDKGAKSRFKKIDRGLFGLNPKS